MRKYRFVWDDNKHESNFNKHGISFEEAATVFKDPNYVEIYDEEHSLEESRFMVIGFSENMRVLTVCHCYRDDGNIIRIISARKATKGEIKIYGGA